MDFCTIQNLHLKAAIRAKGAELCGFRTSSGLDLLWDGNPAIWPRQAPHLFPVVGRLPGDVLVHHAQEYPMPPHGFARGMDFRMVRLTREECTLVLTDDETTRAMFPFAFELRIRIALEGPSLHVCYELNNRGKEPLPANLGALPAFRWPIQSGFRKEEHRIRFELPELAPICRLVDGCMEDHPHGAELRERILRLSDKLFRDDTLVFKQLRSHKIRYDAPGSTLLEFAWEGFQHLGIWGRPGAGFICLQPWSGLPGVEVQEPEFTQRPEVALIPVGGMKRYRYSVTVISEP